MAQNTIKILKFVAIVIITGIIVLCTGCNAIDRVVNRQALSHEGSSQASTTFSFKENFLLTNSTLEKIDFEDTTSVQNIEVIYQHGLQDQAKCVADKVCLLISLIDDRISFNISIKIRIYLLRVDEIPRSYNATFKEENYTFSLPFFLEACNESTESIFERSLLYPYLMIHELVEASLIRPESGYQVLGDISWKWFIFKGRTLNYTRWFRDGFANYAGYIAAEIISSRADLQQGAGNHHQYPLSSLSKVGKHLFSWHQYSSEDLANDYYNAAFGLFVLIRHEFGEEAIRKVVERLKKLEYPDGKALIKLFSETLDTDIVKMVEDFEFPDFGFESRPLTPALAHLPQLRCFFDYFHG